LSDEVRHNTVDPNSRERQRHRSKYGQQCPREPQLPDAVQNALAVGLKIEDRLLGINRRHDRPRAPFEFALRQHGFGQHELIGIA
jgi:hypothetical protein